MAVTPQPQTALGETLVEDADLEAALEQREKLKEASSRARKTFAEADEQAKSQIRGLELGGTPARVGRFLIGEHDVAGRSVAFETEPSTRVSIRLLKEPS